MTEHLGDIRTTATAAIITGDPDRVPVLAESLGPDVRSLSAHRGFVSVEVPDALNTGQAVLVVSTGIGGPATAIVTDELWHLGVTSIIRVGTCGSMQRHVRPGHLVIPSGIVRDEGTSRQYMPLEVPAIPDPHLLIGLVTAAREKGIPHHVGITHCKDAYSAERPFGMPMSAEWSSRWNALRALGVLATEMEAAALFAAATVRRIRAAAAFIPVDSSLGQDGFLAAIYGAARAATLAMCTPARSQGREPA
jgi:uridine phosphorylase